jgi:signal transduction histidine kinase
MTTEIDILLVDDEARNLDALEVILTDPSYRLLRAGDADQALRLLLKHDVAAIILDIKMPGISGFELATIIKGTKKTRQIPIIFLTAYLMEDQDVIAGYGAGAVDYLTKPVNSQILRHKVAVFAELFRKTRALAELNDTLEARVKERTAELEQSEVALRAADKQKDEFIAVLAHELRNPLAPLRTGIDTLLHSQSSPASQQRTLTVLERQVSHMVRLIDDLLDVSRISRGVLDLKSEPTDLAALLRASVENVQSEFEKRGLQLTCQASTPLHALVDSVRISQIVGNLLHNAAKFTPKGGWVRVELVEHEGQAWIQVADSGLGISAPELERIFDMFARIDSRGGGPRDGLGIGLALARRLAMMHGGTLNAESGGIGKGTRFTLALPLLTVPKPIATLPAAAPRAEPAPGLNILIIEDNPDVAELMTDWLEKKGHRITLANDGPSGLSRIEQDRPQLVLCDIGLPGMDGNEVCREVRKRSKGAGPFMVALSGWGAAEDRRKTKESGFDHHFVKPVAPQELEQFLQRFAADKIA